MNFKIRENSFYARIARFVLGSRNVAMVLGRTIYLSGVDRKEFLKNKRWVAHEMVHIEQFQRHGFLKFLFLYLLETLKRGYFNNKFEAEARRRSENIS